MVFLFICLLTSGYSLTAMEMSKSISTFSASQENCSEMYRACELAIHQSVMSNEELEEKKKMVLSWVHLGQAYYHGFGVEIDYARARGYFEKVENENSSKHAQAQAWLHLGIIYYYGNGVGVDKGRARGYFEKAAQHEESKEAQADAQAYLGLIYYMGEGGTQMFEGTYRHSEGENGEGGALALTDYDGQVRAVINYNQAREYFEKAANQKFSGRARAKASLYLGMIYYKGLGVTKNYVQAREYFEKVELQELEDKYAQVEAWLYLGMIYHQAAKQDDNSDAIASALDKINLILLAADEALLRALEAEESRLMGKK